MSNMLDIIFTILAVITILLNIILIIKIIIENKNKRTRFYNRKQR